MTDAAGVTVTLDAVAAITGPAGLPVTPTLVVRCHEGKLDAYASVGRVLHNDLSDVRLRFDGRQPVLGRWNRSSDMVAVFAPDPAAFLRGPLASADTFRIEVRPFDGAPLVVVFAPRGLRELLPQIQSACPRVALDAMTIDADAKVAALIATVEQYKTTSVENKKLGLSVKWSTTIELERQDRFPCSLRLRRTGRGAGAGSFSTVLDLSTLANPPVTSEWTASSGTYGKILLKKTDGTDAVEWDTPTPDAARQIAAAMSESIVACRHAVR